MGMTVFWIVALIAFGIIEGLTVGLLSIWFAAGALAALIATLLGASIVVQVILFLAVSCVALMLMRPLSRKYINRRLEPTNADRAIGREAVVTEEIDNLNGRGRVNVAGVSWTARSDAGEILSEGAIVTVLRIEGVKLFVTPVPAVHK